MEEFKIFNDEVETKIQQLGYTIDNIGLGGRPDYYKECNWWTLVYGHLFLSIYFDPEDKLGFVGRPYYELYTGDDTFRYLDLPNTENPNFLLRNLKKLKNEYKKDFKNNPENYL